MAWIQQKRVRYTDYIRQIVGDPDEQLFSEDELKSAIDRWAYNDLTTMDATASNNKYHVRGCGCGGGGMAVYELAVSDGVDNAVYILDEAAGVVLFDADDPDNTATEPDDGDTIEVQYYRINTGGLLSELFMILSSNHAKLTLAHNIMGVQMDLKELSDAFYAQSVRWQLETCSW